VTLAGQKARLQRPRVRQAGGGAEVDLPLYQALQSPEAMPEAALTVTVVELQLPELLRQTLATTNPIESAPKRTCHMTLCF
jgi:hypothetical protein